MEKLPNRKDEWLDRKGEKDRGKRRIVFYSPPESHITCILLIQFFSPIY
jgi:hypothetical protein